MIHILKKINRLGYYWLLVLGLGLFSSCQTTQDIAGKFNGYFLSNERILGLEDTLFNQPPLDYIEILQVLPPIDTMNKITYAESFDFCIKKASHTVQWFKRSKWLDDCYLIIGKARFYQGDFVNALNTFRYVQSNTSDLFLRNHALIYMIWLFSEQGDMRRFAITKKYLEDLKPPFSDENLKLYHRVMANHYRRTQNLAMTGAHLKLLKPYLKTRLNKSRFNFLLGQIYELYKRYEDALVHYQISEKYAFNYEIRLQAQMRIKNIESKQRTGQAAVLEQFYKELDEDEKNWDLRDKIYFAHASFLLGQNEIGKASQKFNQAIQLNSGLGHLKGQAYLAQGKVLLEQGKYSQAANYYDSASNFIDPTFLNYEKIQAEGKDLIKFRNAYNKVRDIDKLIYLYGLSETERAAFFEKEIQAEKNAILQKVENQKINATKRKKPTASVSSEVSDWYFYDEKKKILGSTQFIKIWGQRKLQDHWRRSQAVLFSNERNTDDNAQRTTRINKPDTKENLFENVASLEQRIQQIPKTEGQIAQLKIELETHLYNLAKVYIFDLENIPMSIQTYRRFVKEYPFSSLAPEAYYTLFIICRKFSSCTKAEQEEYRRILLHQYSDSFYANIVKNPNYVAEQNAMNAKVEKLYATAFAHYKNKKYGTAESLVKDIMTKYPKNKYEDKVLLLSILIQYYNAANKSEIINELQNFISIHQESPLKDFAGQILEVVGD